jgi:hypothetical protein
MYPIDSLIRDAGEHVEGSAFRSQKVHDRNLGQSDPGSAESDIFDEMIRKPRRVDGDDERADDTSNGREGEDLPNREREYRDATKQSGEREERNGGEEGYSLSKGLRR